LTKFSGLSCLWHRSLSETAASAADIMASKPPVQIEHSQLLIDGLFVDAASGLISYHYVLKTLLFH